MQAYTTYKKLMLSNIDVNYPTQMIIPNRDDVFVPSGTTAYGFVAEEGGSINMNGKVFNLHQHMYFAVPGEATIQNVNGFVCLRENYNGLFTLGGPIEKLGRLKYIDGCSDTLLLAPTLLGEPCLNYLYVPPHIDQTTHTHPSVRVGCVLAGKGYCVHEHGRFDLVENSIFLLKPEEQHSFHTQDNYLRIVVYHPDSDFGPTHETHPMINKTYVDGQSLRGENKYRTTVIQ